MTTHRQRTLYVKAEGDTILVDEGLWEILRTMHHYDIRTQNSCQGNLRDGANKQPKVNGYITMVGIDAALKGAEIMLLHYDVQDLRLSHRTGSPDQRLWRLEFPPLTTT